MQNVSSLKPSFPHWVLESLVLRALKYQRWNLDGGSGRVQWIATKGIKSKQRWVGESERSGVSDGQTSVTSGASKPSVLSCRWGLVLQRPRKKRPIFFFYCPQSRYLGDKNDEICFPSACLLLWPGLLCSQEKPAIFNLLYLHWAKSIFPSVIHIPFAPS